MLCLVWDLVSPSYTLGNSQLSFLLNSTPSTHTQNDAMLKAMENNIKLGFLNTSYGSDSVYLPLIFITTLRKKYYHPILLVKKLRFSDFPKFS